MKILKPTNITEKGTIEVYNQILLYFKDNLYQRLADIYKNIFNQNIKYNSISSNVMSKLRKGEIYYDKSSKLIKGKFDAKTTKELKDAGYIYRNRGFYKTIQDNQIQNFIYENERKSRECINEINNFLIDFKENINQSIDLIDNINLQNNIENWTQQMTSNFGEFGIIPEFSEYEKQYINDKYTTNLKYDIKSFLDEDVIRMRQELNDEIYTGGNINSISEYIQHNYYTTQKKSMFLARNECKLAMTEYSTGQYKNAGINKYIWKCAEDERVRATHYSLNNKIFDFNNPPVSEENGERSNPGQYYNCRCVAIPVIEE